MNFKQVVACFVGGVICALVALVVTPAYSWMGLIAGFVGGYVAYEFRQFCRGVVIALRQSMHSVGEGWKIFFVWLAKPHPFIFVGVASGLGLALYCAYADPVTNTTPLLKLIGLVATSAIIFSLWFMMFLSGLTDRGAKAEGCTWETEITDSKDWKMYAKHVPMTYTNFVRWVVKGAVFAFVDVVTYMPKTFGVVRRFTWILFLHIHSSERVSCGIYGSLGGITSYLVLVAPSMTSLQQGVLVFFGGLLGVGFGFVGQKVVATRILPASGSEAA